MLRSRLLRRLAPVVALERGTRNLIEGTHEVLAYLTAALVLVHIAGALRHHFVKKNDVLRRMMVS